MSVMKILGCVRMDDVTTKMEDSSVSVTWVTNLVQMEHHAKVTHNPTIQTVS